MTIKGLNRKHWGLSWVSNSSVLTYLILKRSAQVLKDLVRMKTLGKPGVLWLLHQNCTLYCSYIHATRKWSFLFSSFLTLSLFRACEVTAKYFGYLMCPLRMKHIIQYLHLLPSGVQKLSD
jgi:hypothetical protein